jgi:AcrR family transcriptional regulator
METVTKSNKKTGHRSGMHRTARALLEAAIIKIEEGGEPNVKVEYLCAELDYAVTTVYQHFGSRRGLIDAAQRERWIRSVRAEAQSLLDQLEPVNEADEFAQTIHRSLGALFGLHRRQDLLREVNALGGAYANDEQLASLNDALAHTMEQYRVVLSGARDRGWIRAECEIDAFVTWMMLSVFGQVIACLDPHDAADAAAGLRWRQLVIGSLETELFGAAVTA